MQEKKMLESTTKFTSEQYEMGVVLRKPVPNLLNSYCSTLGQHYSLELRFQRDTKLEMFISTVNRYKFRKKVRKDIELVRIEGHLRERLMFAILFSTKPIEAWQSKTNSASSYKEVCLIEKILA